MDLYRSCGRADCYVCGRRLQFACISTETVDTQLSNIDTQLQRRNDLIPNFVNTVKGYASHESEVLGAVSDARAKLAGATTTADLAAADSELSSALSRLLMVVENYPDLKADTQFTALSDELAGTENRIAVARKDYNDAARAYNTAIKTFPKVILRDCSALNPRTTSKRRRARPKYRR